MIRERGKGVTADEVARTLQAFARAADSKKSYPARHAVVARAMTDLTQAFDALLKEIPEVTFDVGQDAITFQGEKVLEGTLPETSIPMALHRDGLRRIGFSRGLTAAELEVVVSATAQGLSFAGMGEDIVSTLWRYQLAHVWYLGSAEALDARLQGELESLVETLDPGGDRTPSTEAFQPINRYASTPAYRDELLRELVLEDEHTVAGRATRVLMHAWREPRRPEDIEGTASILLKMFDAALVDDDARLATTIARAVKMLPDGTERAVTWLKEAGAEARLRRLIAMLADQPAQQEDVLGVIDAIGRPAVPALFALLPALTEPAHRRAVSERIVRYGVDDLGTVKELINRDPTFLAQEAIFILGRLATPEAQSSIRDARLHPKLHVRLALVESLRHVPAELALAIALELLQKEEDPKVLAATARSLPRYKTKETADALDTAANRLTERPLPFDTKLAILISFAAVNPGRAVPLLARYVKRGEGLLVRRDAEELAAAAVRALGSIRGQRTHEIVEKASQSRSKLVKEAARDVLQQAQAQGDTP